MLMGLLLVGSLIGADWGSRESLRWEEGRAYRTQGQNLQQAGRLYEALAAYQKAAAIYPSYAEAYNDMGVVLESLGRTREAEQAYWRALELKPNLAAVHSNLALLYESQGKVKEAGEHWLARVRLGPPDDPWVGKARQKLAQYGIPIPVEMKLQPVEVEKGKKADRERKKALEAAQARVAEEAKRLEKEKKVSQGKAEVGTKPVVVKGAQVPVEMKPQPVDVEKGKKADLERKKALEVAQARVAEEAKRLEKEKKVSQGKAEAGKPVVVKGAQVPVEMKPQSVAKEKEISQEALKIAKEYEQQRLQIRAQTVQELYRRGLDELRAGRYEEAERAFRDALTLDPNHRPARDGLERVQTAQKEIKRRGGIRP
jgi:Flp pilus assembly protein TadD